EDLSFSLPKSRRDPIVFFQCSLKLKSGSHCFFKDIVPVFFENAADDPCAISDAIRTRVALTILLNTMSQDLFLAKSAKSSPAWVSRTTSLRAAFSRV